ncbi:hypothetical protein [Methanococcus maripaludis]|uniref:Uncharacterized protein n=1 Tax=Methanococcus maripaludis TaxID=39152 RepID=A0A7J9S128_METMI|nr:hypothetical protein [Methanococcus maripaludis]MBB6067999.1 hypothetical protein [Methanococcus maripaludis]
MAEIGIRLNLNVLKFKPEYIELLGMTQEDHISEILSCLKILRYRDPKKGDAFIFNEFKKDSYTYTGPYVDKGQETYPLLSVNFLRGEFGNKKSTFSSDNFKKSNDKIDENQVVPYELYLSFIPYTSEKILFISGNYRSYKIGEKVTTELKNHYITLLETRKNEILKKAEKQGKEQKDEVLKKLGEIRKNPFECVKAESESMIEAIDTIKSVEIYNKVYEDEITRKMDEILEACNLKPLYKFKKDVKIDASGDTVLEVINSLKNMVRHEDVKFIKVRSNIVAKDGSKADLTFDMDRSGIWIPIVYKLIFQKHLLNLDSYSQKLKEEDNFGNTFEDILRQNYNELN